MNKRRKMMLNSLRLIAVTIFLCLLSAAASHAAVTLESTDVDGTNDLNDNEGPISVGPGKTGDFEVFICTTFSDGNNFFNEPPAGFESLDAGECGGPGQCILGIFTGFAQSSDPSDVLCSWVDITQVYGGGSFRYSGVDRVNPVIDIACESGAGGTAVAPSVITEPDSAVIRVAAFGSQLAVGSVVQPDQVLEGSFSSTQIGDTGQAIEVRGLSFSYEEGGPTGSLDIPFLFLPGSSGWRACTIAIRTAPRNIPTLSEWGMIAAAAGLMVLGISFAVRRKRLQASV
jgi:hypothetical protein